MNILPLLLLTLCLSASAQSSMERRLECLAMVEGGSDTKPGPCGEISRYCIMPSVWRQYSHLPLSAATNPFTARKVAFTIMDARTRHRPVSDANWAILWHCPGAIGRLTQKQADFAQRFKNLCEMKP